mmetsp:Transcript_21072/g.56419  ORF Transcript_21072/g.56419 Transcript_21072/m.56419 type:complete len:275 (+) Transcript_21072:229-1053(+)
MVGRDLELLEGHRHLVVLGLLAGHVFGTACTCRACKQQRRRWFHARPKERKIGLRMSRCPLAHLDAGLRVPWNLLAVGEVEACDTHVDSRLSDRLVLRPRDVALVLRAFAAERLQEVAGDKRLAWLLNRREVLADLEGHEGADLFGQGVQDGPARARSQEVGERAETERVLVPTDGDLFHARIAVTLEVQLLARGAEHATRVLDPLPHAKAGATQELVGCLAPARRGAKARISARHRGRAEQQERQPGGAARRGHDGRVELLAPARSKWQVQRM